MLTILWDELIEAGDPDLHLANVHQTNKTNFVKLFNLYVNDCQSVHSHPYHEKNVFL